MPELDTDRLILRPFGPADTSLLHQLFIDPFIRKYLWDDEILEIHQSKEVMELNISHFEKEKWGLWKILSKASDTVMGFTGLWYFFGEPHPQLLYGILERYTGKGYASEAAKAIVTYAFEQLSFEYLIAAMDEEHQVSQRLAKRIGMTFLEKKLEDGKPTVFYKIEK